MRFSVRRAFSIASIVSGVILLGTLCFGAPMSDCELSESEQLQSLWSACRNDHDAFNSVILGRGGYWSRQREICRSVRDFDTTLVPTGNGVGKSYVDAGILHSFLYSNPGCMVVATAPSQTQLEEVLWKEVERAWRNSRIPLGGRLLKDPLKVDLGGGWEALAYSTSKVERFSGHHNADLLALIDEASGVANEIYEAIDSLNPSRKLMTGNPLRPDGVFYDRCMAAQDGKNPLANVIQISSLESPHIHLDRSPWGLASRLWLENSRNDYGEGSLWWVCHVLGLFPDSGADTVLPWSWLQLAGETIHVRRGNPRMAIDLAEGNAGAKSVIAVGDDGGLLSLKWSNTWTFEATAGQAALMVQRWGVEPHNVSFDVGGIGADFAQRLITAGIVGARPYRGGAEGGKKFGNLRSAAAWRFRQRLDTKRQVMTPGGVWIPQQPYSIRPDWLAIMRPELQGLRYTQDDRGRIVLEPKEDFAKRLKHSPDFADTMGQLFAFAA